MGFQGDGFAGDNYATESAKRRGMERAIAKNGHLTVIEGRDVVKPVPSEDWHEDAREMWVLCSMDEASDLWSTGDWLRLKMICSAYSGEQNNTYSDGTPRAPRAQILEVLFNQLTELRLSARAKQADGFLIDRNHEQGDTDWLSGELAELEGDSE